MIALRRLPASLDPLTDLDPWAHRIVHDALFEGLLRRDPQAYPFARPALADRCLAVPEDAPRDVYCHLRPGAKFHDDSPVTTEDVVYSLEFWLDARRGGLRGRHGLSELKRVEVVDAGPAGATEADPGRWVRIGFGRVEPLALERITAMKVVPKAQHRGRRTAFGRKPIGSGPMTLTSFESERIVLETWPGFGDETAEPLRIVMRALPDGAEALTLLRRGDVHIVAEVAPVHVPSELAKPGMAPRFAAYLLTPARYDIVLYNLRRGTQAGPKLRSALHAAVPRHKIATLDRTTAPMWIDAPVDVTDPVPLDLDALAQAGAAAGWGMAGLPAALPVAADAIGTATASGALDEIGWPIERGARRRGNTALRLVLLWDGARGRSSRVASALREAWRSVGIHVPHATASWSYIAGLMRRGDFDIGLARLATHADADLFDDFHSRGAGNIVGVRDKELDAALEAYRAARDAAQRRAAKQAVADRLTALKPVTVAHAPAQVMLVSRRVEGLAFVDDLPRLDLLGLGPPADWTLRQPRASQ